MINDCSCAHAPTKQCFRQKNNGLYSMLGCIIGQMSLLYMEACGITLTGTLNPTSAIFDLSQTSIHYCIVTFDFSPHQEIIFSFPCNIQLHSLSYENALLLVSTVLPPSFKYLKLHKYVVFYLKRNIEHFSYFYFQITLFKECDEKKMHNKRLT